MAQFGRSFELKAENSGLLPGVLIRCPPKYLWRLPTPHSFSETREMGVESAARILSAGLLSF